MQIEIIAANLDRISKQQGSVSSFLSDRYCWKLQLTDLLGHDMKSTSDINLILNFYVRP